MENKSNNVIYDLLKMTKIRLSFYFGVLIIMISFTIIFIALLIRHRMVRKLDTPHYPGFYISEISYNKNKGLVRCLELRYGVQIQFTYNYHSVSQ